VSTRKSPRSLGRGPRRRPRGVRLRGEEGFTLFETLIAAVVLLVGLVSLFGLLDVSVKASAATRAREGGTNLAREILEDARTLAYAQISPTSIVGELQVMHGLENTSGGPTWQINRRGVTYTVTVKECAIDDPKDGFGQHVVGGQNVFCKDPGEEEGAVDFQPEDLKRITAEVAWTATGRKPSVTQVETLAAAGEAPGLSASELRLFKPTVGAPTAPVIVTQPAENKLFFSAHSPLGTKALEWSLDGVRQTNEPTLVTGTEWQFSWLIPTPEVSDGAYQVSVQAVDTTGVYGPPISLTVTLIRSVPSAPKITYAGFNEIYVSGVEKRQDGEVEWQANTERNVIGYRVYNTHHKLVCPENLATLSLQTSCVDKLEGPEANTSNESNTKYTVVALYHPAVGETLSTNVAESPEAARVLSKTPQAPTEVTKLEANRVEGAVVLKWEKPAGGAPVVLYRVYRDTKEYTGRYGIASPAATEFTDAHAVGPHEYWVTAVSESLTESPFVGLGPL